MRLLKKIKNAFNRAIKPLSPSEYWTKHLVANEEWIDRIHSLGFFHWRNAQYPGYIELMPVDCANGLSVLDYGCGPGNDLVGFSEYSKTKRLVGIDVSSTALMSSKKRLLFHSKSVELYLINEETNQIPLESGQIDLVHSSGVLHHVKDLSAALKEINRVMKIGGKFQVMVYNYDSIWVHLYVAYIHRIERKLYSDVGIMEAFEKTTDGPDCPVSKCYKKEDFLKLVENFGFKGCFKGAAVSISELSWMNKRFEAIQNINLPKDHLDFLSSINFNERGHPLVNDCIAGIDGCFEFIKKENKV
jgi:ubiquinone/menaquinone biosynthesis C-methylase UbiE